MRFILPLLYGIGYDAIALPQVAIVSLDDLQKLEDLRRRNSARALLTLVHEVRGLLKDEQLPPDLAERHDYYLWEEDSTTSDL